MSAHISHHGPDIRIVRNLEAVPRITVQHQITVTLDTDRDDARGVGWIDIKARSGSGMPWAFVIPVLIAIVGLALFIRARRLRGASTMPNSPTVA